MSPWGVTTWMLGGSRNQWDSPEVCLPQWSDGDSYLIYRQLAGYFDLPSWLDLAMRRAACEQHIDVRIFSLQCLFRFHNDGHMHKNGSYCLGVRMWPKVDFFGSVLGKGIKEVFLNAWSLVGAGFCCHSRSKVSGRDVKFNGPLLNHWTNLFISFRTNVQWCNSVLLQWVVASIWFLCVFLFNLRRLYCPFLGNLWFYALPLHPQEHMF